MKNITKRLIPLIVLTILMLTFSACSGESTEAADRPDSGDKNAAVTSPSDTENIKSDQGGSPQAPGTTLTAKTVILTVDGDPVYWPEFHFWLKYIGKYYKAALGVEEISDWDAEQNGMQLRDFFLTTAVGYACKDRAIEARARKLDVGLTEKDLAEIEERRTSNIKIYGSAMEYRRIVSSMYISEDVFNYLTKIDYLGNHLFEHLFGDNGEKFSDADVSAYIREGGFMCAKYIFRSNLGPDGNVIGAEGRLENESILKDLLARLDASEQSLSLFTELMNEFGQENTLAQYPHGRLIAPGGKGEVFEAACLKLKESEYSDIVTTGDGCYIILRMPIYPAMIADSTGNTLRYRAAYETFKKQVEGWSGKMKVDYGEAYQALNVEELL